MHYIELETVDLFKDSAFLNMFQVMVLVCPQFLHVVLCSLTVKIQLICQKPETD